MAALRQWVPQVQQAAEMLIDTALKLGAHPDDRDAVTDMTLLMYACKSGAAGVGNTEAATRVSLEICNNKFINFKDYISQSLIEFKYLRLQLIIFVLDDKETFGTWSQSQLSLQMDRYGSFALCLLF